jgi:hypothetical protein
MLGIDAILFVSVVGLPAANAMTVPVLQNVVRKVDAHDAELANLRQDVDLIKKNIIFPFEQCR